MISRARRRLIAVSSFALAMSAGLFLTSGQAASAQGFPCTACATGCFDMIAECVDQCPGTTPDACTNEACGTGQFSVTIYCINYN